jgi:heme exporter protein D
MIEFFHMGGYALYVWVSYGVAAVILIANIVLPKHQHKVMLKTLSKKIHRAEQLK